MAQNMKPTQTVQTVHLDFPHVPSHLNPPLSQACSLGPKDKRLMNQ